MECPSCSFNSLPGAQACARCGTPLNLEGVDVEPPRAPAGAMARRLRLSSYQTQVRWRDRLDRLRGIFGPLIPQDVDVVAVALSVIPGGGHWHLGRARTARIFFLVWLSLLILGLLQVGSPVGYLLIAGALGTHSAAISTLIAAAVNVESIVIRVTHGVLIYACLIAVLYLPGAWALTRVAAPLYISHTGQNSLYADGDVIVRTGAWTLPGSFERGELVVARIEGFNGGAGVYVREGVAVDRVLAVPGDTVAIKDKQLLVNGAPPAPGEEPVATMSLVDIGPMTLQKDNYFILPSTIMRAGGELPDDRTMVRMCTFPKDRIAGRILFRTYPFRRIGPLK